MIIEKECSKLKWKDFSELGFLTVLFFIILQSCGCNIQKTIRMSF